MASSKFIDGVPSSGITIKMYQNMFLIWLDGNITKTNIDCCNTITQLERVVNTIKIFTDSDQCLAFLKDMDDEKFCIIIGGSVGQVVVPRMHHMFQVDSIFIFCCNKQYHEQWTKEWSKIKGVFTEIKPICDALKQAELDSEQNATSFTLLAINDNLSNTNLDRLNSMFIFSQVLKEILLNFEFEKQHFIQLIDYCLEMLGDNEAELKNLRNFEQKSISWDTNECFLYPILNHALRVMDLNAIIKLGFYIGDFHRQIKQLHKKQFTKNHSETMLTVYRGQGMYKEEFDNMQKTLGGFISFNNFLTTNKNKEISLDFAQHILSNPSMVGILFVMTMNLSKSTSSFATVNKVAYLVAEDKIIFGMHTIFRIQQIQSIDENSRLFQVKLELTDKNDEELRALTKHIRKETFPDSPGWFRLGEVLVKMNEFDKAQQVYEILLKQKTKEVQKAPVYHQLGLLKDHQGEYEEAIRFYEKAIDLYKETRSPNDPEFGMFYNNIAIIYTEMHEYTKALEYYEKSLKIRQQSHSTNHPDIARSYSSIGGVQFEMAEYTKAMSYFEKALDIQEKSLPPHHPDICITYSFIGSIYFKKGEYANALSYYEKRLEIQQQSLVPDDPDLGMSYNNMGAVFEKMANSSKALEYYQRAVDIGEKSLPSNNPSFKMYKNNLERMKKI